jgi:hypothetical protein
VGIAHLVVACVLHGSSAHFRHANRAGMAAPQSEAAPASATKVSMPASASTARMNDSRTGLVVLITSTIIAPRPARSVRAQISKAKAPRTGNPAYRIQLGVPLPVFIRP